MLAGAAGVEVEAEMGELDRDLGIELQLVDALQHPLIMGHDLVGLGPVGDVLAEVGEGSDDTVGSQALCCGEGGPQLLAGHEAAQGPSHEAEPRHSLRQPLIL